MKAISSNGVVIVLQPFNKTGSNFTPDTKQIIFKTRMHEQLN